MPAQSKVVSHFPKVARRAAETHVDVDMLKVEHGTPLPHNLRSPSTSKYELLFKQMKPGSCIVCEFDERGKVVSALIKYIAKAGLNCKTKSLGRCADGHARVWMLKR